MQLYRMQCPQVQVRPLPLNGRSLCIGLRPYAITRSKKVAMINSLLFVSVVLIWGSSWIMVRYQVGLVPVEASIAYRMGSAAMIMFIWAAWQHASKPIKPREHFFLALQGALIFSTNFFLLYRAAGYLTTGLIAVVFSTASAMTIMAS